MTSGKLGVLLKRMAAPAASLAAVWGIALIVIVASSEQPTLAGDEYAYWATAFFKLYGFDPVKFDPMLQAPGADAYETIIAFLRQYFVATVMALRMIQIFLYLGCAYLVARATTSPTAGSWRWPAALMLTSPFALYDSAIMPESWFFTIGAVSLVLLACASTRWAPAWTAAAGFSAAQAFFFKPHAVALVSGLLVGTIVLAALAPGKRWRRIGANTGAFLAACALSLVLGMHWWRAKALIGGLYMPYASLSVASPGSLNLLPTLAYVLADTTAAIVIAGPAVFAPLAAVFAQRSAEPLNSRAGRLWIVSAIVLACAVAMTSVFTQRVGQANPGEALRVHARYFAFYAMICGVSAFGVLMNTAGRLSSAAIRWSSAAYLVFWVVFIAWVLPGYKVYPWDAAWLSGFIKSGAPYWPSWRPPLDISLPLIAVLSLAGIAAVAFPKRILTTHIAFVLVMQVASGVAVLWFVNQLRDDTRDLFTEVRAFSDVAASKPNEGVIVVADRYGRGSFALWGLAEPARVVVLPAGSPLTPAQVPADAPWVMLTEPYDVEIPYAEDIRGQSVRMLIRAGGAPAVALNSAGK
ncbi:MAG TPA: hypothetical protein VMU59_10325 [Caulobacteraceae bacterium]|nr:hypothetical protein [Caulobacteraceae bacterium]